MLVDFDGAVVVAVEHVRNVVHSDENAQDVGLQVKAIRLPAVSQLVDFVAADAPIENFQGFVTSQDPSFSWGAIIVQDMRDSTPQELQGLASRLRDGSVWTAGVVDNFAA